MDQSTRRMNSLNGRSSPASASSSLAQHQPDSPIDLSQLSTRRCAAGIMDRSASESCLAGRPSSSSSPAGKRRRVQQPQTDSAVPSPLDYHHRSVSSAELAGYRTPLDSGRVPLGPPPPPAASELLGPRCMSESRLGPSNKKHKAGLTDRTTPVMDNNNSQLEFLLRRTASESILPLRSGEGNSMAIEMFKRQQHLLIQQHYQQQLLLQEAAGSSGSATEPGSSASSSSSSSSSSYHLTSPWLYLGLYSQMIQQIQASQQQHQQSIGLHHDPATGATTSGQISAGPNSPAVAASASGSDGEGAPEDDDDLLDTEEDLEDGGFNGHHNGHGKKRSPRALTGKHVRLGTGASPQTLNTLRLKILERKERKKLGVSVMGKKNGGILPVGNAVKTKLKTSRAK